MRLLVVFLLLCLFGTHAAKKPDYLKDWKSRKQECMRRPSCAFDESDNCVNRCISKQCYEKVFNNNPLEDGEIDKTRSRDFLDCVKLEEKERRASRSGY
mmetsp:Transcript_19183/g.35040  ORF Transcript_19183/g.35040 Transcript_19183/m.35040 type:complete len:99 (-) Transcript_19183:44-340(-)